MTVDMFTIKKWRRRAGGLKHDFRLSERRICTIVAKEFNVPLTTIRYYLFDRDKKDPRFYDRLYDLKYKRVIRHMDSVLPQVFNGNPELSLNNICIGINNLKGISLKEKTLERLIGKYEGLLKGPPIVKTETGNYQLNTTFYNS